MQKRTGEDPKALARPLREYVRKTRLFTSNAHRPVRTFHFREPTAVIPIAVFHDRIPLRNSPIKPNVGQARATIEGTFV